MIDIHTIGAGGGSIAKVDAGGGFKVGPESAGASPGPACYNLGGSKPTVTDANLVLGRLLGDRILDGRMTLDSQKGRNEPESSFLKPWKYYKSNGTWNNFSSQ